MKNFGGTPVTGLLLRIVQFMFAAASIVSMATTSSFFDLISLRSGPNATAAEESVLTPPPSALERPILGSLLSLLGIASLLIELRGPPILLLLINCSSVDSVNWGMGDDIDRKGIQLIESVKNRKDVTRVANFEDCFILEFNPIEIRDDGEDECRSM